MTKLYVDVDDTILARCLGEMHDLRPGVMTQLTVLSKLFSCSWATHWPCLELDQLIVAVNASHRMIYNFDYLDWRKVDSNNKAPAIIAKGTDFYWLEDEASTGNMSLMKEMNLMDRYIPVPTKGLWGFTRACQVLFGRAGITTKDIEKAGGKKEWFQEPLGDHFDWNYF